MLQLKFEAKTSRVKGVCFHHSKSWVITSLYSGEIIIWDYIVGLRVMNFQEHEGAVRGVDFHLQLPLFVSGGDDMTVRLWDYKLRKCTFVLKGHIDYVRTVRFHHELPWILSAADDQTMRIWNYQSRECVNIITGHSHFVMCAQFHHERNYIVSGSLDGTVKLWDYSILRKKLTQSKNASTFIGVEIECIKTLDGHERGVDWVAFHPLINLIASSSDDRKIKIWKFTNDIAWQHSTLTDHAHNVSCVLFDAKSGCLISNSEDKTLRIWNTEGKTVMHKISRQNDRYWAMAIDKHSKFLAAGHDSGLEIFEINRRSSSFCLLDQETILNSTMLLIQADGIKTPHNLTENLNLQLKIQKTSACISRLIRNYLSPYRFIVGVNQEGVITYHVRIRKSKTSFSLPSVVKPTLAIDACFVSENQVAFLIKPCEIVIESVIGDSTSRVIKYKEETKILRIFGTVRQSFILLVSKELIILFNLSTNTIQGSYAPDASFEISDCISSYYGLVLLGSSNMLIFNIKLDLLAQVNEAQPFCSVIWDDPEIILYTTTKHWKYALPNGKSGVLKTLEDTFFILYKSSENDYAAYSNEKKAFQISRPPLIELTFKLAIMDQDWKRVRELIKDVGASRIAMMAYLVKQGYAPIALELASTHEEKFALAIQATNFRLAYEICNEINTNEYWEKLGNEAIKQGVYDAYELACQKLKEYDRLNFLYSLQGNVPKLEKMVKWANNKGEGSLAFNAALLMNNGPEMESILRGFKLDSLATLCAEAKSGQVSERLKALGYQQLSPLVLTQELDLSNWPHHYVGCEDAEEQA